MVKVVNRKRTRYVWTAIPEYSQVLSDVVSDVTKRVIVEYTHTGIVLDLTKEI